MCEVKIVPDSGHPGSSHWPVTFFGRSQTFENDKNTPSKQQQTKPVRVWAAQFLSLHCQFFSDVTKNFLLANAILSEIKAL